MIYLKKGFAIVLVLVLIIGAAGCGATKSAATTSTDEVESNEESIPAESAEGTAEDSILKGETISFLTSQGKFFDEYNTMAEAIEEDYGCKVEFQVVPDNEYYSMLRIKLSTAEAPDVFEYNYPTHNAELNVQEYIEDLSDEPWVDRLVNPELLKDAEDGKFYALPKESSSSYMAVYYNKDILESVGYTDPQPKTYDEFIEILEAVKNNTEDVTPLYASNADTWTTQIFMTSGIPVTMGEGADETFAKLRANEIEWTDIPEVYEVLENYIALEEAGYFNEDHLSASYDMAQDAMGNGRAAMYVIIEQFAIDMASKYPELDLGAFVIPQGDNDTMATGAYVQGLFVPKSGEHPEVAKEFLRVWSLPEYQNLYYDVNPGFSAFEDVDAGDAAPALQYLVDNYINTGKYVTQVNDQVAEAGPIYPDLWGYYVEAVSGVKTPEEVFATFQKEYVDFMQQIEAPGF